MKDFKNARMEFSSASKTLLFKNSLGSVFFALVFDKQFNISEIFTLKGVKVKAVSGYLNIKFSVFDEHSVKSVLSISLKLADLNVDRYGDINLVDDALDDVNTNSQNEDIYEKKKIIFN